MAEKVLPYSRSVVPQTEFWSCGPGAAEIVLNSLGLKVSERQLITDIGTDRDGTDYVGLIEQRALNKHDPAGKWKSVYLPNDPPTKAQKDTFWAHVLQSIDANNRGLVLNWVVPPWNRPKPVPPSTIAFSYPNSWTWHYVACMGFNDDDPKNRRCWIADSGFRPGGGWVSFEQTVSLITPKGYAYSAAPVVAKPQPKPLPKPEPPKPPATDLTRTDYEWRATQYGDPDAVAAVVAAAKTDNRGKQALALLERVNPAALHAYIQKG